MRIVVTGGSRGIGLAIAKTLAQRGDEVIAISRWGGPVVEGSYPTVRPYLCDLASCIDFDALIDAIWKDGPVDALVNNAGISPVYTSAERIDAQKWNEILQMNLTVPFLLSQAFARKAIASEREAMIVMVSSIAARVGLKRLAAYTASKAGLSGLTRALSLDWAPHGIRVNAIEPGFVETDMTAGLIANRTLYKGVLGRTPLARLAQGTEVAQAVAYLLSPDSNYITGTTIAVDGGYTAG